ncbi:MAG: ABC transporter ATP-binding protein, partial [Lachnospiraceae bacterium]|nr:ABC transporter ATP-binding protein [Lachnospiraceae bacterium]
MELLKVEGNEKYYGNKSSLTKAIDDLSFKVEKGEFVAIMGASGSGKTTLLNCVSTIDRVTSGHIYLEGENVTTLKGKALNKFRSEKLGFIFQDFNLLDNFSLEDNILLPLVLAGEKYDAMKAKMMPIVKSLGIESLIAKYPYEVSGGQKQRVAIARSLITNPKILLADEPTGALDSKSSTNLLRQLRDIN